MQNSETLENSLVSFENGFTTKHSNAMSKENPIRSKQFREREAVRKRTCEWDETNSKRQQLHWRADSWHYELPIEGQEQHQRPEGGSSPPQQEEGLNLQEVPK